MDKHFFPDLNRVMKNIRYFDVSTVWLILANITSAITTINRLANLRNFV